MKPSIIAQKLQPTFDGVPDGPIGADERIAADLSVVGAEQVLMAEVNFEVTGFDLDVFEEPLVHIEEVDVFRHPGQTHVTFAGIQSPQMTPAREIEVGIHVDSRMNRGEEV